MPNSATAADDGLKTYKLTGAGWVETNDSGIKWADQLNGSLSSHIDMKQTVNSTVKSSQNLAKGAGVVIQSTKISAKVAIKDTYVGVTTPLGVNEATATYLLDPNGYVYSNPAGDGKISADMPVVSNTSFFVTQIGAVNQDIATPMGVTDYQAAADAVGTLYIKARQRAAGEQGGSSMTVSMPQSGDPAAAWTQSAPLLVAVLAVAGAVGAVMTAKRKA